MEYYVPMLWALELCGVSTGTGSASRSFFGDFLLAGIRFGFRTGFVPGLVPLVSSRWNMKSAGEHPTVIDDYLGKAVASYWVAGPFLSPPFPPPMQPVPGYPEETPTRQVAPHYWSFLTGRSQCQCWCHRDFTTSYFAFPGAMSLGISPRTLTLLRGYRPPLNMSIKENMNVYIAFHETYKAKGD